MKRAIPGPVLDTPSRPGDNGPDDSAYLWKKAVHGDETDREDEDTDRNTPGDAVAVCPSPPLGLSVGPLPGASCRHTLRPSPSTWLLRTLSI